MYQWDVNLFENKTLRFTKKSELQKSEFQTSIKHWVFMTAYRT